MRNQAETASGPPDGARQGAPWFHLGRRLHGAHQHDQRRGVHRSSIMTIIFDAPVSRWRPQRAAAARSSRRYCWSQTACRRSSVWFYATDPSPSRRTTRTLQARRLQVQGAHRRGARATTVIVLGDQTHTHIHARTLTLTSSTQLHYLSLSLSPPSACSETRRGEAIEEDRRGDDRRRERETRRDETRRDKTRRDETRRDETISQTSSPSPAIPLSAKKQKLRVAHDTRPVVTHVRSITDPAPGEYGCALNRDPYRFPSTQWHLESLRLRTRPQPLKLFVKPCCKRGTYCVDTTR